MDDPAAFLTRLIDHPEGITSAQRQQLVTHLGRAPFSTALLVADPSLWGGFWHFDVIGPGYTLPAVELAVLRAVRLDQLWPAATTVEQFVDDLRQVIGHPQAALWWLRLIDQPCAVLAAPASQPGLATVVWYCATTDALHAGYRTAAAPLLLPQAAQGREAIRATAAPPPIAMDQAWLDDSLQQTSGGQPDSLSAALDREILRVRTGAGY
ncbi:MAG: hypothetical protein H6632_01450 [Anaerolineales bacterium]|nr:hypothetical protein [Anaerolineales bacterium]